MPRRQHQVSSNPCTRRDADLGGPYNAEAHLDWLLGLNAFRMELGLVRAEGMADRRVGRAWRDQTITSIAGDLARIERWFGRHRKLERVLPPKLRKLVPALARDLDAPIYVPKSRSLAPDRAARLRRSCERTLDPDAAPLSDADRKFLGRALTELDPVEDPTAEIRVADPSLSYIGLPVGISATQAAVGSWHSEQIRDGFPAIGVAATESDGGLSVIPFGTPAPRMNLHAESRAELIKRHDIYYLASMVTDFAERFTDADYWRVIAAAWIHVDEAGEFDWRELFTADRSQREAMMEPDERAALAELPDRIQVFRGFAWESPEQGFSWTPDRRCAEWFASEVYHPMGTDQRVAIGTVAKRDVIAYLMGKEFLGGVREWEILALPECVEIDQVVSLTPRRYG